ncbi:LysR family transcriptional regulator [Epibacterium ulvae]|nr:LysR family transcriptional regulator [Epibacterium ulvae]
MLEGNGLGAVSLETGSMARAAANLGSIQPAISLTLRSLEESLGIVLFDRDTRNLKPVPEANYLLSEADRWPSLSAR